MKQKMSTEKKSILAYSIELIAFSVVFGVLGVLKMLGILGFNDKTAFIFNIITLVGGAWGIGDFIWYLCSKRRRERNFLPDKICTLVLAIYIIVYDIICIVYSPDGDFRRFMLGAALLYVCVIYMFQGIYHYFKPVPGYLEDIRKAIEEDEAAEKAKQEELAKKTEEENKEKDA